MPNINLQKWDGGIAEDIRTLSIDENEKSLNFDIFTNPHKLLPYPDSIAETVSGATMAQIQIADIDVSLFGGVYGMTGVGYNANADQKAAFFSKASIGGAVDWSNEEAGATASYIKNSGVVYKDKFYALTYDGSGNYKLYKFVSAASVVDIGTIVTTSTLQAKPFVHPQDNVLYIVIGTGITTYDGTTFTTTDTILPAGYECTSLCEYGTYLAITMRPLRSNGNSVTYLWGRDATINTLQGTIPWGEGNTLIVENLYNSLFAVIQPFSTFVSPIVNKIIIRGYSGGEVEQIKSITVGNTDFIKTIKFKSNNKLYFGSQNADDCIYVLARNKSGNWVITKDRYLDNGSLTTSGVQALSMLGDVMWVGINSTYKLMRSKTNDGETATYNSRSVYLTTINPGMEIKDRNKDKQLLAVRITYTGKTNGTIRLGYSIDGSILTGTANPTASTTLTGSSTLFLTEVAVGDTITVNKEVRVVTAIASDTSLTVSVAFTDTAAASIYRMKAIISETTTAIEGVKEAASQNDGLALLSGRDFQFQIESTGGVEVKSIEYSYKVLPTSI